MSFLFDEKPAVKVFLFEVKFGPDVVAAALLPKSSMLS